MKIFKAQFVFSDVPDGAVNKIDVIDFEGHYWIVPTWLESKVEGVMWPLRIIRLDLFQHQTMIGDPIGDFVVNEPISIKVFDGIVQEKDKWAVIENPKINYPIQELKH